MEEESGLMNGVECRFIKTDPEIIESIAKRIKSDFATVKAMMRYNIFTVNQFSILSGIAVSSVLNKTRPVMKDDKLIYALDYCFPFKDLKENGPKFIIRNEKSEKYLIARQ